MDTRLQQSMVNRLRNLFTPNYLQSKKVNEGRRVAEERIKRAPSKSQPASLQAEVEWLYWLVTIENTCLDYRVARCNNMDDLMI